MTLFTFSLRDRICNFSCTKPSKFWRKDFMKGKKLRTAQGDRKLLLTESAIYTAWVYNICKSFFPEASNAMALLG